mmetsp:Transcript_381/g.978  ORF Transcript_381/g.978 Transcript_381/m.978 type:complete len:761 (+) Transcript_381:719-3001(+)|eukprot:CAMPEP_0182899840 /NCGR_PEP_ID=MMETSP0034_2-20130328/28333_1 /TAXON_ID=156128 /ORGANISM="Nephroselmis pyriformis, Strain CCMP717" /LENGTH=760 /DNA_ID=CAMNT_0025033913 /DNA_START=604 /DNA_END=2886 /DNA_ORIENTATION=-
MIASSPPTWGLSSQVQGGASAGPRMASARSIPRSGSGKGSTVSPPSVLSVGSLQSVEGSLSRSLSGRDLLGSKPLSAPISIPRASQGFVVTGSLPGPRGSSLRTSPASRHTGTAMRPGSIPTIGFTAPASRTSTEGASRPAEMSASPPAASTSPKFGLLSKQLVFGEGELVAVRPLPPSPPKEDCVLLSPTSPRPLRTSSSPETDRRICESALGSPPNELEPWIAKLLSDAQEDNDVFKSLLVRKAFRLAVSAHAGQVRKNGDPALVHCVETARIMASCGLDEHSVAAALLSDVLDTTMMTASSLKSVINDDLVVQLVKDVSKFTGISRLVRHGGVSGLQLDQLRSMLMSMGDYRVVLIKLADRLHNMRTISGLEDEARERFAQETLEVFAPLANRLGSWRLKSELEDLSFHVLHKEESERLQAQLESTREGGSLEEAMDILGTTLGDDGVSFEEITGRPKNLYSIFMKMKAKGYGIDDIHDVRAVRIIVPDEASCYSALKSVHGMYGKVDGKFKDYVKSPKANGYQSLHTVVRDHNGEVLEVQIRTANMHYVAEFGMAAHWRYKEKGAGSSEQTEAKVAWLRWLLSWDAEMVDTKLRVEGTTAPQQQCQLFHQHDRACHHFQETEHSPACCADAACSLHRPPDADDEPEIVIMSSEGKLELQTLDSGATAGSVVAQRAAAAGVPANRIRIFVNAKLEVDPHHALSMGDVIEVVVDAEELYGEDEPEDEDWWSPANFERSKLNRLWDVDPRHGEVGVAMR